MKDFAVKDEETCDVCIVGGGPGGLAAAIAASESKASVILLEDHSVLGSKSCAGALQSQTFDVNILHFSNEFIGTDKFVLLTIEKIRFVSPFGDSVEIDCPIHMIDRKEMEMCLVNRAVKEGAEIRMSVQAKEVCKRDDKYLVKTGDQNIKCSYVIGADGASSMVRQFVGIKIPKLAYTLEAKCYTSDLDRNTILILMNRNIMGYCWVFPESETSARIGIGGFNRAEVYRYWRPFVDSIHVTGKITPRAWAIPIRFPNRIYHDGIFLVGDAAGLAVPHTGAGISATLFSGKLAGQYAALSTHKKAKPIDFQKTFVKRFARYYKLSYYYLRFSSLSLRIRPLMNILMTKQALKEFSEL